MFENLGRRFAALESSGLIQQPGAVDRGIARHDLSAGAQIMIYGDLVRAVLISVTKYLRLKGLDKDTIQTSLNNLIDLFKNNHDIMPECADWFSKYDFFADQDRFDGYCTCIPRPESCANLWPILSAARSALGFSSDWCTSYRTKFNDREKAMFDELTDACARYYKARETVEHYLYDQALITIDGFMTKYAEILQKTAKDWFEAVSKDLKWQIEALRRRQAEKKAEKEELAKKSVASDAQTGASTSEYL